VKIIVFRSAAYGLIIDQSAISLLLISCVYWLLF